MALTLSQAKVLGVLHTLGKVETAGALALLAGLSSPTARTALRTLESRGLVASSNTMPTFWRITSNGAWIIRKPCYREYLGHPRPTSR